MTTTDSDLPVTHVDNGAAEQSLLTRISNMMVSAQKEHFGRGPDRTKSYLIDDLLFIVMRGGITQAEQTMLDFGREDLVRAFRQEFENEMTRTLVDAIEEITGRRVLTYQSQILFNPHVVVEVFVFDGPPADVEGRV